MSARSLLRRLGQKRPLCRNFSLADSSAAAFKNVVPYTTREVEDDLASLTAASRCGNKVFALELRRKLLARCPRYEIAADF